MRSAAQIAMSRWQLECEDESGCVSTGGRDDWDELLRNKSLTKLFILVIFIIAVLCALYVLFCVW